MQFYLPCLVHAYYLIGDQSTGTAAVVDPQRDIDQYRAFASENALTIKHVFLTHLHADFLAGHLEFRSRVGASIYLGAAASADYPFTPLHDGDIVEFGCVRLKALETPGHTPESVSLLVFDLDASDSQPHAIFTDDTLSIGDVGRPDLRVALGWSATDLGGMLFDSLHNKLLGLPDESLVYPAHGAGSLCGDGWYDHVNGPIMNHSNVAGADVLNGGINCGTPAPGAYLGRCGYGARQPLLVISPWAKHNFVDHTTTDRTSIIRFIEDNWQLGRIDDLDHPGGTLPDQGSFDQLAGTLLSMFDFQRDPDLRPYILDHFTGQPVDVDED